jgi:hypothetical protein
MKDPPQLQRKKTHDSLTIGMFPIGSEKYTEAKRNDNNNKKADPDTSARFLSTCGVANESLILPIALPVIPMQTMASVPFSTKSPHWTGDFPKKQIMIKGIIPTKKLKTNQIAQLWIKCSTLVLTELVGDGIIIIS